MALKDDFLGEVRIGNTVEITVGPKMITGKVVGVDLDTVKIQRENGKVGTISLDSIGYYELVEDEDVAPSGGAKGSATDAALESLEAGAAVAEVVATSDKNESDDEGTVKLNAVATPTPVTPVAPVNNAMPMNPAVPMNNAMPMGNMMGYNMLTPIPFFEGATMPNITSMDDLVKDIEDPKFKSEMNGIASSLNYAINMSHEKSPADYKISENIAKIRKTAKAFPGTKEPYDLLGILYAELKCEGLALENFDKSSDNVSGFVMAERCRDFDKKILFACKHFSNDEKLNPFVVKFILDFMISRNDFSLFDKITLEGNGPDRIKGLVASYAYIFDTRNIPYDRNVLNQEYFNEETLEDMMNLYKERIHQLNSTFAYGAGYGVGMMPGMNPAMNYGGMNPAMNYGGVNPNMTPGMSYSPMNPGMNMSSFMESAKMAAEKAVANDPKLVANGGAKVTNAKTNNKANNGSTNNSNKKNYVIPEPGKIYVAAKHAWEHEKNLEKARVLYIEAIKNSERMSSSIPDLVNVLRKLKRYVEAAEYLGKYGPLNMKQTTYENVKAALINEEPKTVAIINRYETEEALDEDYFLLAQRAEITDKNIEKAIALYKKAIDHEQRLSSSVPNLVSIYIRLEMVEEALELLDRKGTVIEINARLNLKLQVLTKTKNKKYEPQIIEAYEELIKLAKTEDKRLELMVNKANTMFFVTANYTFAIELANEWLKLVEKHEKNDWYNKHTKRVYLILCRSYHALENMELAKKYAEVVLEFDPEEEFAKSIITGTVGNTDDVVYEEENMGTDVFSKFIMSKVENINLESELKNKQLVREGLFIGNDYQAKKILDGIQNQSVANDEVRSNNFFTLAKLERQILDKDDYGKFDSKAFNEQRYLSYIARGTFSYGNFKLFKTDLYDNTETARYCFNMAAAVYNNSEKVYHVWVESTLRYIQTYFMKNEDIRKIKFNYPKSDQDDDILNHLVKALDDCISKKVVVSPLQFVGGLMEFFDDNNRIKNEILNGIFMSGNLDSVIKVIQLFYEEGSLRTIEAYDEFQHAWEDATKRYYKKKNEFLKNLGTTIERVFSVGQMQDSFTKVMDDDYVNYLSKIDMENVKDFIEMFVKLGRYNEISDFEYKSEILSSVDESRKRLEERIASYPTKFSYEGLMPRLEQLQAQIYKEASVLYGGSEPQISVAFSGECALNSESKVARITIAFTNRENVQSADNFTYEVRGEGVRVLNDNKLMKRLLSGNGKAAEEILTLKLNDKIINEQVFSIIITVSYQYKQNMSETITKTLEYEISIPLYNQADFEPIVNKFEPHKNGSEVKDKSMFYGRDKEIEAIIKQISDANGNMLKGRCLALYGQTRTGKSTVLYHLENKLREINPVGNIIINVGSIGEENLEGNNITEFLYTILDVLKSEIRRNHPDLKVLMNQYDIEIEPDYLLDDEDNSQLHFNSQFKKFRGFIEELPGSYNIIVMIDEFTYVYDWIRNGVMTDRFMKFWKAFIQNNEIFAIIVGQDHMMKFVNEQQFTNDFGSTDLRKVTYLSEEDAKRLMYEPIPYINKDGVAENRFRKDALDRLYELTSGSAFLIMNLCAGLVDYLNENRTVYIQKAHIDDYLKKNLASFEESRFFEPQYDDKGQVNKAEAIEKNKRILRRIAQCSNKKEWAYLRNVVICEEDRETLENLEARDVIIIANNERCKIKVALYKEWLIEKYGSEV